MLTDRIVVISGAGSGLGRALSEKFIAAGAFVIGFGRTESALEETAGKIGSDRFSWQHVDVSNFRQVAAACAKIDQAHDRIDILFNNAAVYPRISFIDETAGQWADALSVNVNGPANCCKAVLPVMIRNGFGRIYNMGSFADRAPIADSAAYSCSKGAVHALGPAIQADLEKLQVDVEVHEWVPGHMRTKMSDFTGIEPEVSAQWALKIADMPSLGRSALFVNDSLWVPPRSLRGRVKDLLTLRFLRNARG